MSFAVEFDTSGMNRLFEMNFETLAPQMLEEVAPLLEESTKTAIRSVIGHPGDSDLVNSVKASKPKLTKTDACIVNVTPRGSSKNSYYGGDGKGGKSSRKYPVSNGLKAVWLEYGVAGRQPAKPWREQAVRGCEGAALERMQKKYEELTGARS